MQPALAAAAQRLRRRALGAAFAGEVGRIGLAALLAGGSAVLVARAAGGLGRVEAAGFLAVALVAPVAAWMRARRRVPSVAAAAALVDVRSGGSGLVVADAEAGDPRFGALVVERVRRAGEPPAARLGRPLALLGLGAAFAAAALALDVAHADPSERGGPADVAARGAERARERLATLEEVVRLDEESARELEERIERLAATERDARLESVFEALDRLERSLAAEAERAGERLERAAERVAAAAAEARAGGEPGEVDRGEVERALAELRDGGLGLELPPSLAGLLGEEGLALPEGLELDLETLAALSEGLRELLERDLAKLSGAGLLDPAALERAGELARLDEIVEHECDESCESGGT